MPLPMELCCQASRYDDGLEDPAPMIPSPLNMSSIPWKPEIPECTYQHFIKQRKEKPVVTTLHRAEPV
ncbi:hypothetical protein A6R68_18859 [Neotoma lepida]|uniref:Uncharacterized protein n=1 Tax=Neotoma lepida TaxID=56216 RepID=A0A1A6HJJ9_NEOLE|nr:hypothetical protein A6R68_18859 [Neotoma lepida]